MWKNTGDEPKMLERIPIVKQVRAYRKVKRSIAAFLSEARENREDDRLHNMYCRYALTCLGKFESENAMYVHKTGTLRDKINNERGTQNIL